MHPNLTAYTEHAILNVSITGLNGFFQCVSRICNVCVFIIRNPHHNRKRYLLPYRHAVSIISCCIEPSEHNALVWKNFQYWLFLLTIGPSILYKPDITCIWGLPKLFIAEGVSYGEGETT